MSELDERDVRGLRAEVAGEVLRPTTPATTPRARSGTARSTAVRP